MKIRLKIVTGVGSAIALMLLASCVQGPVFAPTEVAAAAKSLRSVVSVIQVGLALAEPESPTARALDPGDIQDDPFGWDPGPGQTPQEVYDSVAGTGTKRFPSTGYYTVNGNQVYFTLAPQTGTYYRMLLYTYPAFDLSVAYTIEEYLVNSLGTESWYWANLNLAKQTNRFVSLKTVYTDGSTGTRTLVWTSSDDPGGSYYGAFAVADPDPLVTFSFDGYRYEEKDDPLALGGAGTYSSHTTESIKSGNTNTDSIQYYTETSADTHSGLTFVLVDAKQKKVADKYIVTRMVENTTSNTKTIRSVGEIGTTQYYIDKVDIFENGGSIDYTSTHDVYDAVLPRGVAAGAKSGVAIHVLEDSPGSKIYTGTMEEVLGSTKTTSAVTIDKDALNKPRLRIQFSSSGPRDLAPNVSVPLTTASLADLSIELPAVKGTFEGAYDAGSLYGAVTTADGTFDVIVGEDGILLSDTFYPY